MSHGDRLIQAALAATRNLSGQDVKTLLAGTTIIVSAPRSGSNLLFEMMAAVDGIWTIGGESHGIYRAFPHLRAENARLDSGRLNEQHADTETCRLWRAVFLYLLRDRQRRPLVAQPAGSGSATHRVLEKTPRNALNMPFLLKVFPQAKFIFLYRDPRACIASLAEAWIAGLESGRFVTFQDLPGWDRRAWCFLLPPGWRSLNGKSLLEIAAFQWKSSNSIILDQLAHLSDDRWTAVDYASLVRDPGRVRSKLGNFIGPELGIDSGPLERLPLSRTTLTPPHPDKWKKYETELAALLPSLADLRQRMAGLVTAGPD